MKTARESPSKGIPGGFSLLHGVDRSHGLPAFVGSNERDR
jgi:hypothetical protein